MKRRPHGLRLIATLVALVLLGTACGSDSSPDTAAPVADPPAEENSFTVVAYQGEELLGGSEISFDSLLDQGTPVVLNYWAPQCPPCLVEMPWLQAAYERYEDSVLLVGIDVGPFTGLGTNEQGAELLKDLGITYPAGYAVDDAPLRQLEVRSMPSTVFFDAAGEVVGRHAGILTEHQIQDWFANLTAEAE
ncbi:MAG: TlpA family protein disulfide reductase [Acidimicrobiales bacterium]